MVYLAVVVSAGIRFDMKFYLLTTLSAFYFTSFAFVESVATRKWRNSGTGAIALEEAWTIPELLYQMQYVRGKTVKDLY
jgi:hypothetical protein